MENAGVSVGVLIGIIVVAIDLSIRVGLLLYIPQNRKPTSATAWLLAIYIAPILGAILFLIIGSTKLSKNRRHKQQTVDRALRPFNEAIRKNKLDAGVEQASESSAKLVQSLSGFAPTKSNAVRVLSGYQNIIDDMIRDIDSAEKYVYVEFFAMTLDEVTEPFFAALERAHARKVRVYVLFDVIGSRKYKGYRAMKRRLTVMGVSWHGMLPLRLSPRNYDRPDLRNHRKIVVVDNVSAHIGSLNMIDPTYHRRDDISYIELVSRIEGPAVNQCAAVFASDWYAETNELLRHYMKNSRRASQGKVVAQILPSGPVYPHENNLKLFVSLIHSAQKSIMITNPYLVPEDSLLTAIISAVKRGVHVSIINSEAMDQWMVGHAQRSYYAQLIDAGVHISLYKKPQLQHSKYLVIDSRVAIVGSSNLDVRSFELNFECVAIFYDKSVATKLYKLHQADLVKSTLITKAAWSQRKVFSKLLDGVTRLTSALQ